MNQTKLIYTIILTLCLFLFFCSIWVWLEVVIYGHAEDRLVDDIIMFLLLPIFYTSSKYLVDTYCRK